MQLILSFSCIDKKATYLIDKDDFFSLKNKERSVAYFVRLPFTNDVDASCLLQLKESKATGICLNVPVEQEGLGFFIAALNRFMVVAEQLQLKIILSGRFEPADIPRLLLLPADYLLPCGLKDNPDKEQFYKLFLLHQENLSAKGGAQQQIKALDKESLAKEYLLVRDFVLPAQIGVYSKEYTLTQRLCFNVKVALAQATEAAEELQQIFSYDILLDVIRIEVGRGHIQLMETLAHTIINRIFFYPQISSIHLRIEKLDLEPAGLGIEFFRSKA